MANESESQKVTDIFKKLVTAGLGAAFMTEESIRNYVSDLKLPKDVLNSLLQSAAKSKEDLMNRVGNEVIKMLNHIDIVKEASRFVEEHKFKISAEVEVIKKSSSEPSNGEADSETKPSIRTQVKLKSQ